jgi:hypothetical protein
VKWVVYKEIIISPPTAASEWFVISVSESGFVCLLKWMPVGCCGGGLTEAAAAPPRGMAPEASEGVK